MSVYRIVLLLMLLPCLIMWMTGKAGRMRIADIALLLYSVLGCAQPHGHPWIRSFLCSRQGSSS